MGDSRLLATCSLSLPVHTCRAWCDSPLWYYRTSPNPPPSSPLSAIHSDIAPLLLLTPFRRPSNCPLDHLTTTTLRDCPLFDSSTDSDDRLSTASPINRLASRVVPPSPPISASTVSISSSFSPLRPPLFDLPFALQASHGLPKSPAMNAPGIPSAPLTGFSTSPVQQRPPILSVVPVSAPASGSAGALSSSAASGSASAPGLGSAGLGPQSSGLSSGHIPSHDPGQDQSQPATSPSSASATGGGAAGTGYLQRSRRRWTADEDAKLISAVKAYGSARGPGSAWSLISQGIPGRTNKVSMLRIVVRKRMLCNAVAEYR